MLYRPDFPIGARCAYHRPAGKFTKEQGPYSATIVGYSDEKIVVVLLDHILEYGLMAPSTKAEPEHLIPDPTVQCTCPMPPSWYKRPIQKDESDDL